MRSRLTQAGPCFAFLDRPGSTLGPDQLGEAVGEYDTVLELETGGGWRWNQPVLKAMSLGHLTNVFMWPQIWAPTP